MMALNKDIQISRRKKRAQKTCEQMIQQGYSQHEIVLDLKSANSIALLTAVPPIIVFAVLFGVIVGWERFLEVRLALLLVVFLLSQVVHEGIHALFFALAAEHNFAHVEFGVIWKSLNPYCYCGEVISRRQYLVALLMPGIILGGVVGILALIFGSANWLVFSLMSFLGASADFLVAWMLVMYPSSHRVFKVLDHPEQPGVILFSK